MIPTLIYIQFLKIFFEANRAIRFNLFLSIKNRQKKDFHYYHG